MSDLAKSPGPWNRQVWGTCALRQPLLRPARPGPARPYSNLPGGANGNTGARAAKCTKGTATPTNEAPSHVARSKTIVTTSVRWGTFDVSASTTSFHVFALSTWRPRGRECVGRWVHRMVRVGG